MQTEVTQAALKAAGYKQFTQRNIWQYTSIGWQKCFRDEKGKKYYITIAEYDNSQFPNIKEICGDYSFQPETQFESNGTTFDVQMHRPDSIEQMEEFFENLWKSMNCNYYETY